jgi:hypothetical protein
MLSSFMNRILSEELDSLVLSRPAPTDHRTLVADAIGIASAQLGQMGIATSQIAQWQRQNDLTTVFTPRLVPNPEYWNRHHDRLLRLLFIKTQAGRYQDLLQLLQELPGLSYYTTYGETDVIVRVLNTMKYLQHVEELLEGKGHRVAVVDVASVPYFFGFASQAAETTSTLALERITNALAQRVESVSPEDLTSLVETQTVLGTVVHEDHLRTGRIRAFISVSLRDSLSRAERGDFETRLLSINAQEHAAGNGMPIVSLFRGRDPARGYVLQMIFKDQAQLDRVTDRMKTIDKAIGDSSTLIVAKSWERPESLATQRYAEDDAKVHATAIVSRAVTPITKQLHAELPEQVMARFRELTEVRQLQILGIYQELTTTSPYLTDDILSFAPRLAMSLVQPIVDEDVGALKNVGLSIIRDKVETRHVELARILTDQYLLGDTKKWQSELKMSDGLWRKWGLATWGDRLYPAWNAHPVYGSAFHVDEDILQSLHFLGVIRNQFAHTREIPIDELIPTVRDAFTYSFRVLGWLPVATQRAIRPQVPLAKVADLILKERKGTELSLLLDIHGMQVETVNLLRATKDGRDSQLSELITRVEELQAGQRQLDHETLEIVENLVLPRIAEANRGAARKSLEFLKSSITTLPSNVAGSLIAALTWLALGL